MTHLKMVEMQCLLHRMYGPLHKSLARDATTPTPTPTPTPTHQGRNKHEDQRQPSRRDQLLTCAKAAKAIDTSCDLPTSVNETRANLLLPIYSTVPVQFGSPYFCYFSSVAQTYLSQFLVAARSNGHARIRGSIIPLFFLVFTCLALMMFFWFDKTTSSFLGKCHFLWDSSRGQPSKPDRDDGPGVRLSVDNIRYTEKCSDQCTKYV